MRIAWVAGFCPACTLVTTLTATRRRKSVRVPLDPFEGMTFRLASPVPIATNSYDNTRNSPLVIMAIDNYRNAPIDAPLMRRLGTFVLLFLARTVQ
jgi:hypothetical protein